MTKSLITTILLTLSITFIAIGVNTHDNIFLVIGGFCAGIYNSIITSKEE